MRSSLLAERALDAAASELGDRSGVDGPVLLRERAAILGIAPAGRVSAGGTCRLLRARDNRWIAINLARASDIDLLAAWMQHDWNGPVWDAVADHAATVTADEAVDRAQLLGVPAAVAVPPPVRAFPVRITPGAARSRRAQPRVVDLSALWAGPLCARVLATRGADVVKVELPDRPDGARGGHPAFWERLNGMKDQRTLSVEALRGLLDGADVLVTSARLRAIDQLDLDLERRTQDEGLIWVAITGYGMLGQWRDRVAFGDDAAISGGLAIAAGGERAPVFIGDAPADPLSGLHAAAAAAELLDVGVGGIVDVSMRDAVGAALSPLQTADDRYPAHVG